MYDDSTSHTEYSDILRYYIITTNSISFINSTDIDDCSPNPCQNRGTCIDEVNSHSCSCVKGFGGTNCENGQFTQNSTLLCL